MLLSKSLRPAHAVARLFTTETFAARPKLARPLASFGVPAPPRAPWTIHDVALLGPANCHALDRLLPPTSSRDDGWWLPIDTVDHDVSIDGPESEQPVLEAIKRTYQARVETLARAAARSPHMPGTRLPFSHSRICGR